MALAALIVSVAVCSSTAGEKFQRRQFVPVGGEPKRVGPYTIFEVVRADSVERDVFISLRPGEKPRKIYTHGRALGVLASHRRERLLMNDNFATKANRVVVVEVRSGVATDVGALALRDYVASYKPDLRMILLPVGHAFSEDDRLVLIQIELHYISVAEAKEAKRISDTFVPCWYAVSASTGKVIKKMETGWPPKRWW
jgi:hypothetical protein